MNTRCYRCGWSFSLSREALEEAAVSDAGQKAHVIHCPRCRQAISIPMDQIVRALPPGWTPAAAGEAAPAETDAAAGATSAAADAAGPAAASEAAAPPERAQRRHRHSSKSHTGDSAAVSAAKNSTHPS